jgi:hypothetical protein
VNRIARLIHHERLGRINVDDDETVGEKENDLARPVEKFGLAFQRHVAGKQGRESGISVTAAPPVAARKPQLMKTTNSFALFILLPSRDSLGIATR